MTTRFCFIVASLAGLTGVALGAFGSHALQGDLPVNMLKAWHTAVSYQFIHALALLGTGILLTQTPASRALKVAALAFSIGILLFSGSLYILALTQTSKYGMITPLGGISFMFGWAALLLSAWQWNDHTSQQ